MNQILTPNEIETIAAKLAEAARRELDPTLPEWEAFPQTSQREYCDIVRDVARVGASAEAALEQLAKTVIEAHLAPAEKTALPAGEVHEEPPAPEQSKPLSDVSVARA